MASVRRPFTCEYCGHKMRFFGTRCSYCYNARPLVQRGGLYLTAAIFVTTACSATLMIL